MHSNGLLQCCGLLCCVVIVVLSFYRSSCDSRHHPSHSYLTFSVFIWSQTVCLPFTEPGCLRERRLPIPSFNGTCAVSMKCCRYKCLAWKMQHSKTMTTKKRASMSVCVCANHKQTPVKDLQWRWRWRCRLCCCWSFVALRMFLTKIFSCFKCLVFFVRSCNLFSPPSHKLLASKRIDCCIQQIPCLELLT